MLANMLIRKKMALVTAVALVALAVVGGNEAFRQLRIFREASAMPLLMRTVEALNALLHELQQERAMAIRYVSSGGVAHRTELPAQRDATDRARAIFASALGELEESGRFEEVVHGFREASGGLDGLAAHREAVEQLRVSVDEAGGYYTNVSTALLDRAASLNAVVADSGLRSGLQALVSFSRAKEQADQERAILATVFDQDLFVPRQLESFLLAVARREVYLQQFLDSATPAQKAYYEEVAAHPTVKEAERMKNVARMRAARGGFGVNPDDWFEQKTGEINLWATVEARLRTDLSDAARALAAQARGSLVQVLALVIGTVVVTGGLGITVSRTITAPLDQIRAMMEALAEGGADLTQRLPEGNRDEIGQISRSFNRFMGTLHGIVVETKAAVREMSAASQQLSEAAEQSAGATRQIAAAIHQVAEGANRQADTTRETLNSMEHLRRAIEQIAAGAQEQAQRVHEVREVTEQMTQALDEVATAARKVAQMAEESLRSAREGGQAVVATVQGMDRILQSARQAQDYVNALGRHSQQIGEIVQIISGIADQTNLLALNAAIEAARAGESGRGFAVVAEEVRKLAERSAESTRQIGQLVENIQSAVAAAVEAMAVGTREVEAGTELAGKAGTGLQQIISSIEKSNEHIQEIAKAVQKVSRDSAEIARSVAEVASITEESTAATEEMSASSEQVARSMEHVSAVSEETSASAEEVSASVGEVDAAVENMRASVASLAEMAQRLANLVDRFKV